MRTSLSRLVVAITAGVALAGGGLAGCASAQVAPTLRPVQAVPQHPPIHAVPQQPPVRILPQQPPIVAPPQQPLPPPPMVMRAAPPPQSAIWEDGIVPMCFDDPQADDQAFRDLILAAAGTWEGSARVHFQIAADCADSGPSMRRQVPIEIVHDPEMFAASTHLGRSLLNGGEITLNAEYLVTNRLCGPNGTMGEERCFYADALHELGHALGFSHDHVSPRAPDCLARTATPEAINASESYYDPDSIMNYCNDHRWEGQLSAADKCSVASAYGPLIGDRPTRAECYAMVGAVPMTDPE